MKRNTVLVLSAAAMLLSAVGSQADTASTAPDSRGQAVYQGQDAQGRIVQLTIADIGVPKLVRVTPAADQVRYPELPWTSRIGTGKAASLEH
jgi:major membrane immunogen (membrane-anchored lipoprotein)